MKKFLLMIIVLLVAAVGIMWSSAQSLPAWFSEQETEQERNQKVLAARIEKQGVGKFLGNKFADVLKGRVVLSEDEFNLLLLASLKANKDGRKLLSVSDAVHAKLSDGEITVGAVINLDKVEKVDAKARKAVEKVTSIFPFLNSSRLSVSVTGEPVARNGEIAIRDNFSAKIGAIPISNSALRQLGAKVERANSTSLALKNLSIQSIDVEDGQITLKVFPRF